MVGWAGQAVFDEELVDRVSRDAGLSGEDLGGGGGGGDSEHGPTIGAELIDGGGEGGGLAGAGRSDDEDDVGMPRCRGRRVGLPDTQCPLGAVGGVGVVGAVVDEAPVDPVDEGGFLVEDRLGRERTVDGRLSHGSAIAAQECTSRHRVGHVNTLLGCQPHTRAVQPHTQCPGRHPGRGRHRGGDLADDLGRSPRRLLLGERPDAHCSTRAFTRRGKALGAMV